METLAASVLLVRGVEELEGVELPPIPLRTVMQERVESVDSERVIFGRDML